MNELTIGLTARDRAAAKRADLIDQLIPIAKRLGRKAGSHGVTVADMRLVAEQKGLLPKSRGRSLSFLGAVMPKAGLKPKGWRRSFLAKSHGNLGRIWVHAA